MGRENIGDDVVSTRHWRIVGLSVDDQLRAGQVAVVVAGDETNGFLDGNARVLGRLVDELAIVHVHH
ncbi:hypothetical protein D3C78_1962970 [compost metagenome]